MKLPFRESRRRELVARYAALVENESPEAADAAREYEAELPRIEMSRCPHTGLVLRHTFDPFGLDGLWWNAEAPARPLAERLYSCQSLTGAVRIAQPVEHFAFLAKPGPGAPYVMPELLEPAGITAVVSSLSCGRHTAYAIAYFARDEVDGVRWPNDWGLNQRWSEGGATPSGWFAAGDPEPEDLDFDLAPWLEKGRLLWIAPDDRSMTLRHGAVGCPYVGLAGERGWQRVSMGTVWTDAEEDQL